VQDGVVPRTRVADTLEAIGRIGEKYNIAVSNVFHAGDWQHASDTAFRSAQSRAISNERRKPATKFWNTAFRLADRLPASTA